MTDHTQRLTIVNRKLVLDLNAAQAFLKRLMDPEDFGHAVSQEVRQEAARVMYGDNSKGSGE